MVYMMRLMTQSSSADAASRGCFMPRTVVLWARQFAFADSQA
jgi:hypothetical protein